MAFGIDDAILGIGIAAQVGGALFGSHRNQNQDTSWYDRAMGVLDMQANSIRQTQMNIDATRRKRDIVRQAQVATARAENAAANSGALKSSGIEGARASIFAQSAVNWTGVEQQQESANALFNIENQRAQFGMMLGSQKRSQKANVYDEAASLSGAFTGESGKMMGKVGQWGWGVISNV